MKSKPQSVFFSNGHGSEYLVVRAEDNHIESKAIVIFPFRDLKRLLPIVWELDADLARDIEGSM